MSERSALQEELRQSRPFPSREDEATVGVLRTADVLRHRLDGVFAPRGLTAQQYNVLRILRGAHPDPMPTMEIAERMIERTPGITRLLDRLESKGLVQRRRRADDRRCVLRSITPEGLELLAELDEPVAEANHEAMDMLSTEQTERLIELLDAIREGRS
jgi:DNA-binding MarR family transcriptional regulator